MLRNYLTIAIKVLLRRKFFTFISLFGISLTLVVLMVATAVLDHMFAPFPPETRQNRSLGIYRAKMVGEGATTNSSPGYKLLDRYARNLPGVERVTIFTDDQTVYSYPSGQRIKSSLKRTDGEFWRVLDFRFLEGGPFTAQDVDDGRFVAVINKTTREKFFGGKPAVGQTIEADAQRFRVIGVVADVPRLRDLPFADIWAPLTTAKTEAWRDRLMGGCKAILLARTRADFPAIKEEFKARMRRVELPDPKEYDQFIALAETPFETLSREIFGSRRDTESHPERLMGFLAGVALLFMLLPTVNLVNLNVSRIMERASEIGVRKAFGASARALVGQFIVENVVLTLIGGAIGFVLAALALAGLNESGLIPYAQFALNPRVFAYGLAIAVFFGLLSGVYPAWRMSRLHPVEALKGVTR